MEFLVIFMNDNGEELYRTMVKEGETVIYNGPIPKKPNLEFVGWNKSLKNITDNLIVTAVFEKPKKGTLKLGVMSFVENEKSIHIIEQDVISNEDLYINKEKEEDIER